MRWLLTLAAATAVGAVSAGSARVIAVYPSGSEVPENLLRISLAFDRTPGADVRPRVGLAGAHRAVGHSPFLAPELRSLDGRLVTLLLDPARVKTGTEANEALGRVLRDGDTVTLTYDGRDIHRWHVGPAWAIGPDPGEWRISLPVPAAGTEEPIVVALGRPVDALDTAFIAVADTSGGRVAGAARLIQGETVWALVPETPWKPGTYQVRVNPELEDACGNRVDAPFEMRGSRPAAGHPPTFTVR